MILEGTTSSGAVVPVQVTDQGKVVAEGLQGPQGPEGPQGPVGPPGPAGGYWDRTGTVVSPTNAGDTIATDDNAVQLIPGSTGSPLVRASSGNVGVGIPTPSYRLQVAGEPGSEDIFLAGQTGLSNGYTIKSDGSKLTYTWFKDGSQSAQLDGNGVFTLGEGTANAVTLDPGSTGSPLVRDSQGRLLVGTGSTTSASRAVFTGNANDVNGEGVIQISKGVAPTGADQAIGYLDITSTPTSGPAGAIGLRTDGAWSGGSSPTKMLFVTTPSGSTTPVERMRINAQGDVIFQGAPIIKSPDGKYWAIEVDNTGNLSAVEVL